MIAFGAGMPVCRQRGTHQSRIHALNPLEFRSYFAHILGSLCYFKALYINVTCSPDVVFLHNSTPCIVLGKGAFITLVKP